MTALLALLPVSAAWAERVVPPPIHVQGGITQLTGQGIRVGQRRYARRDVADPFVDVLSDGRVRIYGTGPRGRSDGAHGYLEYSSLHAMLGGEHATTGLLKLSPRLDGAGDQPWDLLMHRWQGGPEVLYGGVMTPHGRRTVNADFAKDNWSRRVYPFTRDAGGQWVMGDRPLFNPIAKDAKPSMIGHAYGHHFKEVRGKDGKGETWLFHEEVSRQIQTPTGKRLVTELFARKMLDPFTASPERVKLLGVGDPPLFGARAGGDYLLEGPRPFEATLGGERYHFITFSSADFANDRYDIHFAYRRGDAIGPYTPITRPGDDGKAELFPFAEQLKARYGLSWVGRAHVLPAEDGSLVAVFHAVRKAIHPEADYSGKQATNLSIFHRDLYAVPLRVSLGPTGTPTLALVDDPRRLPTQP